jgi:hypothetical protein
MRHRETSTQALDVRLQTAAAAGVRDPCLDLRLYFHGRFSLVDDSRTHFVKEEAHVFGYGIFGHWPVGSHGRQMSFPGRLLGQQCSPGAQVLADAREHWAPWPPWHCVGATHIQFSGTHFQMHRLTGVADDGSGFPNSQAFKPGGQRGGGGG